MNRKILIVNDDGILADGLIRLAGTARAFGDVWVVAPETQRSAASHSISLHDAVDVWPVGFPVEGVHAFACSGTPGDCVRIGSQNVMPERPDVVLSGINRGHNVASDIQYSATAGAAFEAAFQGIPGIALSEGASGSHEVTDHYLPEVLKELFRVVAEDCQGASQGQSGEISQGESGEGTRGQVHGKSQGKHQELNQGLFQELRSTLILNVNFPNCPLSECRGILRNRTVGQTPVFRDSYVLQETLPGGRLRFVVEGTYCPTAEEGTDFRAVLDNYVSIGMVRNVC